jgi:CheY-like chemotaxis protein
VLVVIAVALLSLMLRVVCAGGRPRLTPAASHGVILLDLHMPDMNGVEFVEAVKRRPLFATRSSRRRPTRTSELLKQDRALGVSGAHEEAVESAGNSHPDREGRLARMRGALTRRA